jgi:hypothetical protein
MDGGIDIYDCAAVINLIDKCAERGAFQGNELLVVGQLREKFAEVIRSTQNEDADNASS